MDISKWKILDSSLLAGDQEYLIDDKKKIYIWYSSTRQAWIGYLSVNVVNVHELQFGTISGIESVNLTRVLAYKCAKQIIKDLYETDNGHVGT